MDRITACEGTDLSDQSLATALRSSPLPPLRREIRIHQPLDRREQRSNRSIHVIEINMWSPLAPQAIYEFS